MVVVAACSLNMIDAPPVESKMLCASDSNSRYAIIGVMVDDVDILLTPYCYLYFVQLYYNTL